MVFCANHDFPVLRAGQAECVCLSDPAASDPLPEQSRLLADLTQPEAYDTLKSLEHRLGPRLLVPECWQALLPEAGLLISPVLSGGTLKRRFQEAAQAAPGRCWLYLEPMRHILPLPCPTGQGRPSDMDPGRFHHSFFSEEFCCRYAYSMDPPGMFLFDTPETAELKQELARTCGFCGVILPACTIG